MRKTNILTIILLSVSLLAQAQKVTLGSCATIDNGQYQGEMLGGKPNGKGRTTFPNGDTYEGEYEKGRRQGYGVYSFSDGERGFRISSMAKVHSISMTITVMRVFGSATIRRDTDVCSITTVTCMTETGNRTSVKAKDGIPTVVVHTMMVNGTTI